jgi:hypothetical protein
LQNIAKSKETQNFVIQVVETAVKNDGILGALFKGLQTIVSTTATTKKTEPEKASAPSENEHREDSSFEDEPDAGVQEKSGLFSTVNLGNESNPSNETVQTRRKRIRIKTTLPNS